MSLDHQDTEPSHPWYLVQLKPNGLNKAERNLSRQGFKLFCPLQRLQVPAAKAGKPPRKPLFPGYLFVSFNPDLAPWLKINNTYGVAKIVSFGLQAPRPVPEDLVQSLRSRCDKDGHILPIEDFEKGERVRVLSGPFAEFVTNVESVSKDKRIWLLLDILGRQTKVAVRADSLEKL